MKLNSVFIFLALMISATIANSQKIKLKGGDKKVLNNETSVNIEFSYDNVSVGKFKKEQDYITKKKEEYNKKEAGKGDKWAEDWKNDRSRAYEPQFIEQFLEKSNLKNSKEAKYTLLLATSFIEPGYNVGVWRQNAYISATATIVETANRNNVIAVIDIEKSPGRDAMGYDFDTSWRISEAYAKAGKSFAKFLF